MLFEKGDKVIDIGTKKTYIVIKMIGEVYVHVESENKSREEVVSKMTYYKDAITLKKI